MNTRSDIHKYIYEYEPPKLNLVSEYTGVLIFKKKKNALIFFIDGKTDPNIKIVSAVSEALSKNIIIVVSFNETYIEDRLKVKMKKNDGIYPAAWIAETTNHQLKRYKMKDAFTYENIILFYEAFVHKLLVPEINSEDPLISYDIEGRVTRLVGANFNDKVYNVSEDVVVYLYASWDEFSSRVLMEPFENAVEREFISKKASNIKFYKIDVYNNELEYVDVNLYGQFPRLLVFNKQRGDDEPLDFFKSGYGDVSIDAMVSFIKENTDIVFP